MQERNAIDEYYNFKRRFFDPIPEVVEEKKSKKNIIFSKAEKEIIPFYIKYYTHNAIAIKTNNTKNTIHVHLYNIYKKVSKITNIDNNIKRDYQVIQYLKKQYKELTND